MKQKKRQRLNLQGNSNAIFKINKLISENNRTPIKIGKLSREISISYQRICNMLENNFDNPSINSEISIRELKILIIKFKESFDIKNNPVKKTEGIKKIKKRKFVRIISTPIETSRRKH